MKPNESSNARLAGFIYRFNAAHDTVKLRRKERRKNRCTAMTTGTSGIARDHARICGAES
jgi:hypothetical protein